MLWICASQVCSIVFMFEYHSQQFFTHVEAEQLIPGNLHQYYGISVQSGPCEVLTPTGAGTMIRNYELKFTFFKTHSHIHMRCEY